MLYRRRPMVGRNFAKHALHFKSFERGIFGGVWPRIWFATRKGQSGDTEKAGKQLHYTI